MRIIVLGGCGAWPAAGQACAGHLVEHDGFQLIVDLGYATLPRLLEHTAAERVDAALISHGHPDHCADLHPLLRARALREEPSAALPVFAPPGALERVLALDRPGMLDDAYRLHDLDPGAGFDFGPFRVETWALPHFVPSAGLRLTAAARVVAYTGDTGPSPEILELARDADLFIAEATYPEPAESMWSRGEEVQLTGLGEPVGEENPMPVSFPGSRRSTGRRAFGCSSGRSSCAAPRRRHRGRWHADRREAVRAFRARQGTRS